ncbi:MAG TPA: hypothetical protein VFN56_00735 [Candidatus Saccharimonadales bacterium]|nr:hypothetical protein [Candidatus Saccharimonadales bacterium]
MVERRGVPPPNDGFETRRIPCDEGLQSLFIEAHRNGYFVCPWQSDEDDSFFTGVCDAVELQQHASDINDIPNLFITNTVDCVVVNKPSLEESVRHAYQQWDRRKRVQRIGLRIIPGDEQ